MAGDSELERFEDADKIDRLFGAGQTLAEVLTTGAVSPVSLIGWIARRAQASHQKRQAELLDSMGEALLSIRERLDSDFVRSEEFEGLTQEILEKAGRRRELDKRDFYAAAFANSALPDRPSEASRFRMIDTLERLRAPHLWLLATLLRDYEWPDEGGISLPSGFEQQFTAAVPGIDMDAVRQDWRDLEAAGIVAGFPGSMMSTGGARNFRGFVTDYGRSFHQYVTLPYGDVHPRT